jgi:hypothetical protein
MIATLATNKNSLKNIAHNYTWEIIVTIVFKKNLNAFNIL